MSAQSIIWEAFRNSDQVEGRGPDRTVGFFASKEHAEAAVRGALGWGTRVHRVFGSFAEYQAAQLEEIRQRAIAKLTPDERAALGVGP